jgi:hypothetical protein
MQARSRSKSNTIAESHRIKIGRDNAKARFGFGCDEKTDYLFISRIIHRRGTAMLLACYDAVANKNHVQGGQQ